MGFPRAILYPRKNPPKMRWTNKKNENIGNEESIAD